MRTLRAAPVLCLLLCACPPAKPKAPSAELVSQARAQLAERERKLTSYRFHGVTTDLASNQSLGFRFAYRSPAKMRAETEGPTPHVFVFDGRSLRELDVTARKLTTYDLAALPKEKADAFLHTLFAPFAPEGFRAPLLPSGLTAERQVGQAERQELQLTATVQDAGQSWSFTFLFTDPAMDLLDKRITGPDGESRVQVAKQTCEPKLGLCFPSEIVESHAGTPSARTSLSEIAINGPVTDAEFELAVPAGGTEEKKSLAASP